MHVIPSPELAIAEAEGQNPLVFMHTYPGDLAEGGGEMAAMLADARVAFVSTGPHALQRDSERRPRDLRCGALDRQIEEGGGVPGFALVCVHDTVPSWRFKALGSSWPFVQIVSPCDIRLVTRPADPRQVPRPGSIDVVARVFGPAADLVQVLVDGEPQPAMAALAAEYSKPRSR